MNTVDLWFDKLQILKKNPLYMMSETLIKNAIILLKDLIKIKSFSGYEDKSADKI